MDSTGSSWLAFWEFVEISGAIIVTIGVVGEYVSNFTKLVKGKSRKARLEKKSTLILIFGLAIELVGLVATSHAFNLEVARANLEAKQAGTNAAASYEGAAVAKREAGQANEHASKNELQVEVLRKQNDELEAKQIRSITPQQKERFMELVKNYPKCPVKVFIESEEGETKIYAYQIRELLDGAGYTVTNGSGITKVEASVTYSIGDPTRELPVYFLFYGIHNQTIIWPSFQWAFTNSGNYTIGHFWTNDISGTPGMLDDAFQRIGINSAFESSETYYFLKPGEWGIFIPQKF